MEPNPGYPGSNANGISPDCLYHTPQSSKGKAFVGRSVLIHLEHRIRSTLPKRGSPGPVPDA
jgi:hypothetical protein